MDAARHARVKAIFLACRALPPAERAQELERECAGDAELLIEVESLLAFDTNAELLAVTPSAGEPLDPLGILGRVLDERYRVDALVSEGGFGFVYRAWHLRWARPVAIKVLKLERGDETIKEAFVKEGALLNELSRRTTAIVQSYDAGTFVDGRGRPRVFTVIEWLEGKTLAEQVEEDRAPWPLARVLSALAPIAGALGVAHRAGVAHRDVKPANIFLGETEQGTKLLDFGVAKLAREHEHGFASTGGHLAALTIGYAAPEQLDKTLGPTGPWTDVYSLALVCVELLTGRRPFDEADPLAAGRRTRDAGPTPRRLGVEVSDAVEAVFARALALAPGDRYPDGERFFTALEEAVERPPRVPAWALAALLALIATAIALWAR